MDIEQTKIARLVPSAPVKWYHRYQHIYVPLLYPVASLFIVFVKDFQMFATKKYGNSYQNNYPKKEYRIMLASKLFYIFYSLIIPLIVIQLPWWKILIGYLIMHSVLGIFMAVILFPVHVLDDVPFPQADASGNINNSWIIHQIETSTNFGSRNWFLFHLCGGLNIHIPHHLFPGICHIHYFDLNKIIRSVALENGLRYKENTVAGAMLSHLRFLKQMGRS
jgi:linoleoyl-CoA desaturase